MNRFHTLVSTFFYVGYCPVASGTAGTLATIPLYLLLCQVGLLWYVLATVVLCIVGCVSATRAEAFFGVKDPSQVVIDEVVGFLITMLLVKPFWLWILIGFLYNRFFDIVKFYPASRMEKIGGGIGIVMDDVVSSVYAGICLHLTIFVLSFWMT